MAFDILADDPIFAEAKGKVVVLTGGATGIGEATVRLLVSLGALVSFLDTNKAASEKLVADLEGKPKFHHGSVLDWNDQAELFDQALGQHGKIDIVIANAGIDEVAEDAFVDAFDSQGKLLPPTLIVLDVNLRASIYTTKLALSYFRRQNTKSALVVTGSAASFLDTPGIPVYNAAKHGVIGLVRFLRDTLQAEGLVRANVVAPWFTLTPFTAKVAKIWQEKGLPVNTPAEVARAIVYLSLHDGYHGNSIYVADGRYTELEGPIQASREAWLGKENTLWVDQRKAAQIKLGKQDD